MSKLPKHEATPRKARKPQPPTAESVTKVVVTGPDFNHADPSRSMQHDINHVAGLDDVATHLDWIGDAVARLTHDDTSVGVSIGQNRYSGPVQIALTDGTDGTVDTMYRFVTALERIADSVAKLAGLNRPRLESWHEQDEYEPRYKSIACDGGAPGPKKI